MPNIDLNKDMTMSSFYSEEELKTLGLASYGKNVLISRMARLYSPHLINIGNNVRIDDFCMLSGKITLGNYIHIAVGCVMHSHDAGITFEDYSTISSRGAIYAVSDDYSGAHMTNPTVPEEYLGLELKPVHIGKHVIIGTGSTVLPGVDIAEGCAIGSMSLVKKSTEPWGIYAGIPATWKCERKKDLLKYEKELEDSING